jgi:glycosyltransferase involved in cell wall biosynthesis
VVSLRSRCLPELRERIEDAGASVHRLGISPWNPAPIALIPRLFRVLRADVIHSHLEFSNELAVLAARSLGRDRPAVIIHVHNYPDRHYSGFHRWAGRKLASRADLFLALSASIATSIRSAFGEVGRLEIVPNTIDATWLERGQKARGAERRASGAMAIGTVARLTPQKSVHDLIEAMPHVLRARPEARLTIVGDGPLRRDLEERCRRIRVADSVTFTGILPDVADAYAGFDVFVLPSTHEGMPMALLEAMAMGVPVVGTRVPGITELIEHERTGLCVPHGDPKALADAVLRLLADDALAGRLSIAARERVRHGYTRDAAARRIEELYADLCAARVRGEGVNRPAQA